MLILRLKKPELTEKTDDDITDIPPQIDEFDNAIYFDNDNMADGDFTWNDKNAVTSDTYKTPKSRYYIKWSNEYKEACRIIYDKSSEPEDFKKAEQLLLSESNSGNILAIHDLGKLYSTDKLGERMMKNHLHITKRH